MLRVAEDYRKALEKINKLEFEIKLLKLDLKDYNRLKKRYDVLLEEYKTYKRDSKEIIRNLKSKEKVVIK